MSDLFEASTIDMIVADFVNASQDSKINIIGGGVQLIPSGVPFGVLVIHQVPATMAGTEFSFELLLEDESGNPVELPGPAGPQMMRIGQPATAERPHFPGYPTAEDWIYCRAQMVISFMNGLPLTPGTRYSFRARVDGDSREDWVRRIFCPAPPQPAVLG